MDIYAAFETFQQFINQEGQTFSFWQLLISLVVVTIFAGVTAYLIMLPPFLYFNWVEDRQHRFIQSYEFPASVKADLLIAAPSLTADSIAKILDGFKTYVLICRDYTDAIVAVPSTLVDCVWHSFLLSTQEYEYFCRRSLGRFLHHHPKGNKNADDPYAIARAYLGSKKYDNNALNALPTLFTIDHSFGYGDANRWHIDVLEKQLLEYREYLKEQERLKRERANESGSDGSGAACGCGGSC
jgi:hypothetical protein